MTTISLPLNFNSTIKNFTYTDETPTINIPNIQKLDNDKITKIEVLDNYGNWIEPTSYIQNTVNDGNYFTPMKGYPYAFYGSGNNYNHLYIMTKTGVTSYSPNEYYFNIPVNTKKCGIRIYTRGKLLLTATNFTESATPDTGVDINIPTNPYQLNEYLSNNLILVTN